MQIEETSFRTKKAGPDTWGSAGRNGGAGEIGGGRNCEAFHATIYAFEEPGVRSASRLTGDGGEMAVEGR